MLIKIPVSAAIITKNEEARLGRCLDSLDFVDEVVVLDSGSKDGTVELARKKGCIVYQEDWKGYGPQKNSAIQKCRNKWVLIVDADEVIPENTKSIIANAIKSEGIQAYSVSRKNYFHDRWIKTCGWWPDRVVRLLQKESGRFVNNVHEEWVVKGETTALDAFIEHYSYNNYSEMLQKMDVYSSMSAKALYESGKRVNCLAPFSHGLAMFIKAYVIRKGFLDGIDGFIISIVHSGASFLKYAKLMEIWKMVNAKK
ncbi:MAG: glycosyltransferase family 2 protein [Nitrospirae bacterium]|nr:glycosyltransferase family 2 protein [Nitrospirota bacterium]